MDLLIAAGRAVEIDDGDVVRFGPVEGSAAAGAEPDHAAL